MITSSFTMIKILHNGGEVWTVPRERSGEISSHFLSTWENLFKHKTFFGLFLLLAPLGHHCCTQEYVQAEVTLHFCPWVSHYECFSYWGAQALGTQASEVAACKLSSCGPWA